MGDIYTNPPQSRNEAILRATIDGTEYTAPPQSRIEDLLLELKEAIEQGGGSVESYEQLTNKPQINGTTLSGDKSTEDLIPIDKGLEFDSDGKLAVSLGDGLAFNSDGEIDNLTEANPSDSATGELSKLKVGSVIYSVVTKAVNDLTNYYTKSEVYTKAEVNNIAQARFAVVAQLPTQDIQTNVIYLVPKSTAQTNNDYDEYIYALKSTNPDTYGWEKIGDTEIDLSDYVTTQALNTALADYTTTTDLTTLLAGKEPTISVTANRALVSDANGKVSASSATATEVGYLSGVTSAIQTQINSKADTLFFDTSTRLLSLKSGNTVLSSVTIPTVKIVPFSSGTDAQIAAMIAAADRGDIDLYADAGWRVGDERQVTLSAMDATGIYDGVSWTVGESHIEQTVTLVLLDGGTTSETGDAFTGSAASSYKFVDNVYNKDGTKRTNPAFIVGLKGALAETGYMNPTNTTTGSWDRCARRNWCNGAFRQSIPNLLRKSFKKFLTITADGAGSTTNQTSQDYFALAAEREVAEWRAKSSEAEYDALKQFAYYVDTNNRKIGFDWFDRSPANGVAFGAINTWGSPNIDHYASNDYGIKPFGCI